MRERAPVGFWRLVMGLALAALALAALAGPALAQTIQVNPPTLPGSTVGPFYTQTLSASGGTAPYTYAVTGGALPAGLTLEPTTGVISGTPAAFGVANFTITATDSLSATGSRAYSLTITAAPVAVTSVTVPPARTYVLGDALDFVVQFDATVFVTGTPRIALTIGASTRYANYISGSGTPTLRFSYPVQSGDADANGISVGALSANGGTIRSGTGVDAVLTLNSVGSTSGVLVDGNGIVAVDDSYTVQEDQQLVVSAANGVLANDTGLNLTASRTSGPTHGSVTLNPDGSFAYTPQANFFGTDSFQVQVSNGVYSANSTVTIAVVPTTPVVSGVAPSQGPVAGGTVVTISGSDLLAVSEVRFGGAPASFMVNSDSSITATVPAGTPGAVDVTLIKGSAVATSVGGYTYLAPGALSVADSGGFTAVGPVGGPFAPPSKTWTLSNTGGEAISVEVVAPGGVFELSGATSGTSFTLPPAASVDITLSLNAGANALPPGTVSGPITFFNLTNGIGHDLRAAILDVWQAEPDLTLSSSANPAQLGEAVSLTAVLHGGFNPGGTVSFRNGGTLLGSVPVSGGQAVLNLSDLPAGTHSITASYSGDGNNLERVSPVLNQVVAGLVPVVSVSSSANPARLGDSVSFTAVLSGGANPTGTISFFDGGTMLGSVAVSGGQAVLNVSDLAVGTHAITASYSGDASNVAAVSPALSQVVEALGSVTIRQETSGSDAVFGFRSATAGLNVAVATVNGVGQSAAIALPAGSYAVTGDDMGGAGYVLTGLTCNDGDSLGDVASRTATIELAAGEAVVCTFTSVNSAEATTALIEDFLESRARLILANAPDEKRRFDRLNGRASGGGSVGSALLGYLPGVIEGGPVGISTSLGAIEAMAGNQQPGAFDAWFEGTFSLFEGDGAKDRFNSAAFGADYLLNPDLLVGGFVQFDHLSRRFADDAATASGSGWLAGPYVTARLSDNLYLDLLAAGGQSGNRISPDGSYEDRFDATRYLLSAALEGQWTHENWTFSPRVKLSYFEETSDGYVDSLGVDIPGVTVGLGQLAVGPGIGYRLTLDSGVVVDLGLRAEGVLEIANAGGLELGDFSGRLSGTIGFGLVGGANIGLSARLDGLGAGEGTAGSFGVTLSLPAR